MIDSRVKPHRPAFAALTAAAIVAMSGGAALVAASPALAQAQKPIQLAPQKLSPPIAEPAPRTPAGEPAAGPTGQPTVGSPAHIQQILKLPKGATAPPPAEAAEPAEPRSVTAAGGSGVQIDDLKSIDPDTAGTLTKERGGFGADMWAGTPRVLVERLLPKLPVNTSSAVMRDLMRRMLLSIARVPEGPSTGASLVAMRARLLAAMGDLVAVNTLLNATPGRTTNEDLVRVETDIRFLSNDNARACALAGGQVRDPKDSYWQKAFVFCRALAGEHDKAALGISVMREAGENDKVFFALIDSLASGVSTTIETMANPSPLHLAMARVAKAKLPDDVIAANHPGVLRTIAISPNAPLALRLEAAERAEAAGALPVDALRQLYTGVNFSDEALANPLSRAETEGGPMTRALLYHTSLLQTVPTAQAEVVARALALGREEGRYASVVRVFMPVLKRIPPSTELLWFASEAVRALLHQGETLAAESWFALLRASALFNKESSQIIQALMPIVRLMGSPEADEWNTGQLPAWWATVKDRDDARDDAQLLFTLFDALGDPVPASMWGALVADSGRQQIMMPEPALWFRMIDATNAAGAGVAGPAAIPARVAQTSDTAADGQPPLVPTGDGSDAESRRRVGETMLLALLALGEEGPAGADPLLLRQAILSFTAAGFQKEARAIAVEAALAAGL